MGPLALLERDPRQEWVPTRAATPLGVLGVARSATRRDALQRLLHTTSWPNRVICARDAHVIQLEPMHVGVLVLDGIEAASSDAVPGIERWLEWLREVPILVVTDSMPEAADSLPESLRARRVDWIRSQVASEELRVRIDPCMRLSLERYEASRAAQQLEGGDLELVRQNAELERFACSAAHDLQAPLRQIAQYLDLIRGRVSEQADPQAEGWLERASSIARDSMRMVDGFLELARAAVDTVAYETSPGGEIVEEARASLSLDFDVRGATLQVDPLPTLHGPRAHLVSLFRNLLDNALKYAAHEPARIWIQANRRGSRVEIRVQDNGRGMHERVLARIFQPFARGGEVSDISGSGLGLFGCRRIVESMGGRIEATSRPGLGSCFQFDLPICAGALGRGAKESLAPCATACETPLDRTPVALPARSMRFLIIDDTPDERARLREALSGNGRAFEAREAPDAHVGLEIFAGEVFDCVFVGMGLPDMEGTEVIRRLREYDRQIPVVAIPGLNCGECLQVSCAGERCATLPRSRLGETSAVFRALEAASVLESETGAPTRAGSC